MSTFQQGQAAADKEREDRRSLKVGLHPFCWVVREYLTDCHKIFCEALSLAVTTHSVILHLHLFLFLFVFYGTDLHTNGPLDKAVLIF